MKYVISVFYADAEVTVKTNDPEIAILELLRADTNGNHAHVCDGDTGEVLALVNHPDQFATDEFSLMILGVLMKHLWEQDEEPIPEPEPEFEADIPDELLPTIFEVMSALAEQQKAELLPPEEPEECMSAEDMVLKMIQTMGGGLPS